MKMKQTKTRNLYLGKEVFVGIDVHKKTYSVVARVEREVVKKWTTAASPQSLGEQLLKYFKGARIQTVYETGFSGFVLHRELIKQGIHNIVVHAAGVEVAVNNRVKTDKRDAQKLAALLEAGRLRGIAIPSAAQEQHRILTRTREQLVGDRSRVKNRIRMKCHQMGLINYDENRQMTHKLVKELLSRVSSQELTIAIEAYWQIWQQLDQQITKIEKAIKEQAQDDPNESTYRSCPGIGPLSFVKNFVERTGGYVPI